jgi:hypothetical protein
VPGWFAHHRGHLMTALDGLGDHASTGAATRAEYHDPAHELPRFALMPRR